MRWDIQDQLSVDQAVTTTGTVTAHSRQKQSAAQDLSIGRMYALLFIVKVAAGASSVWSFEAVQADVTALTTNVETIAKSRDYLAAELTVGKCVVVPIPEGSMDQLHIGGKYVVASGTTTGTFDCYLVPLDEIPHYKSFPKVVNPAV
jgi:hypothetical protein